MIQNSKYLKRLSDFIFALYNKRKAEWLVFFVALFGSFLMSYTISFIHPERIPESEGPFGILKENLIHFGVYSDSITKPLVPHSAYTPLYPLFIALLSFSPIAGDVANWILHALLAALLCAYLRRIGVRITLALSFSLVFALEPYHLLMSTHVTAEMLLALLLFAMVWSLDHYAQNPKALPIALAALFLSLATLTRPSAEFLILLAPFFIFSSLKLSVFSRFTRAFKHTCLAVFVFLAVLSPWLYRNHQLFGVWSISSLGVYQMLNANIPHYLEWEEKGSAATESGIIEHTRILKEQASALVGQDISKIYIDSRQAAIISDRIVSPFLREHWLSFGTFYLSQFPFQLMTDNWRTVLSDILGEPKNVASLAAALKAVSGNPRELFQALSFGPFTIAFVLGKCYWLILYILALVGGILLWLKRDLPRTTLLVFVFLILYFPFVSLPYLEARYRFPSTPYVFVLAAYGVETMIRSRRKESI